MKATARHILMPLILLAASGPAAQADEAPPRAVSQGEATRILDQRGAERLLANKGLTLQWIDWDRRGSADVRREGDVWKLHGTQAEAGGPGRLVLDGTITEIGADYFTFQGRISITNTPDPGRSCSQDKSWHFAITQNRSYYRLREFEWCDALTDYIDIYF